MRILVPVDGSPLSERALDVARPLAEALRAEVVLFTVSETAETSRHAEQISADVDEQLGRMAGRLGDVPVQKRVDTGGEPAQGILNAVADLEVGHIVMTTHGRSGLSRLAQGSVAEEVLRRTTVPVTMVRPEDGSDGGGARLQAAACNRAKRIANERGSGEGASAPAIAPGQSLIAVR